MDKRIPEIGTFVDFENEYGLHTGAVVAIRRDISNGEQFALVEIDPHPVQIIQTISLKKLYSILKPEQQHVSE